MNGLDAVWGERIQVAHCLLEFLAKEEHLEVEQRVGSLGVKVFWSPLLQILLQASKTILALWRVIVLDRRELDILK